MKKLLYIVVTVIAAMGAAGCSETDAPDIWKDYSEWRETNNTWLSEQETLLGEDGELFYSRVSPVWAPNEYVLVHWFNDRAETAGNLSPMLTSWVTSRYNLYLYDGTRVDSSSKLKDGVFTSQLVNMISGWRIAMMNMHLGDTVQMLVPYDSAYGAYSTDYIPPYSVLIFNVRLTDIPAYEVRP